MKKYLLASLLGVFALFGAFASADYSFVGVGEGFDSSYTPSVFDAGFTHLDLDLSKVSYECPNGNCYLGFMTDSTLCRFFYSNGVLTFDDFDTDGCSDMVGIYDVVSDGEFNVFSSFTVCPDGCSSSDDDGTSSGTFLPNGTDDLKPIINGLETTISEFIPYVVYIGLGLLSAIIGFVAIKRLINRVRAKVLSIFNSRRKR